MTRYALPVILVAAVIGIAVGIGVYTFAYARGWSYLTDDPGGLRQLPRDAGAVRRLAQVLPPRGRDL